MPRITPKTDLTALTEDEFASLTPRQINHLSPGQRRAHTARWISSTGRQQILDMLPMYDQTELQRAGIDRDTSGLLFLIEDFRDTFDPSDWKQNGRCVYPAFQFERGLNKKLQLRKLVQWINVEILEVDRYGTVLHALGWWIDPEPALDDGSPLAHLDTVADEVLTGLATKYVHRPPRRQPTRPKGAAALTPETNLATLSDQMFANLTFGEILNLTPDQAGQLATRLIADIELHRAPVLRRTGLSSLTPGMLSVRLTTNELVFPAFQFASSGEQQRAELTLNTQCRTINAMVFRSKVPRNRLAALYWWLRPDPGLTSPKGGSDTEPCFLLGDTMNTVLTDRAYAFVGKR